MARVQLRPSALLFRRGHGRFPNTHRPVFGPLTITRTINRPLPPLKSLHVRQLLLRKSDLRRTPLVEPLGHGMVVSLDHSINNPRSTSLRLIFGRGRILHEARIWGARFERFLTPYSGLPPDRGAQEDAGFSGRLRWGSEVYSRVRFVRNDGLLVAEVHRVRISSEESLSGGKSVSNARIFRAEFLSQNPQLKPC